MSDKIRQINLSPVFVSKPNYLATHKIFTLKLIHDNFI